MATKDKKIYCIKMHTMLGKNDTSIVASLFEFDKDTFLSFTNNGSNMFRLKNENIITLYKFLDKVIKNEISSAKHTIYSIERDKYKMKLEMRYKVIDDETSLKFIFKNKIKRFYLFNINIFILYKFLNKYLKFKTRFKGENA